MKRILAASMLLVAACSNAGDGERPSPTPSPSISASPSPSPSKTRLPFQNIRIGGRLTLNRGGGATVDANVLEIEFASGSAPGGQRFVTVLLELSNPAGPSYVERPRAGLRLFTQEGREYEPFAGRQIPPAMPDPAPLGRGRFARGKVTFAVPSGATLGGATFVPAGGTAPEMGMWNR